MKLSKRQVCRTGQVTNGKLNQDPSRGRYMRNTHSPPTHPPPVVFLPSVKQSERQGQGTPSTPGKSQGGQLRPVALAFCCPCACVLKLHLPTVLDVFWGHLPYSALRLRIFLQEVSGETTDSGESQPLTTPSSHTCTSMRVQNNGPPPATTTNIHLPPPTPHLG